MRTNTKARPVERTCSLNTFMHALGHQPAPATATATATATIPRTLLSRVGARRFGDFGTVLLAERPASSDLSDRVARWRASEIREDLPLRGHSDQTADDRRFRFAVSVTTIVFSGWIVLGIAVAALTGKL